MKELTINEIQAELLEIMKDIHMFCQENDIQYTLAYGSLIGAVRHKGFIPWDDDMDIWMTRPNYEKFIRLYRSKNYVLKHPISRDCYLGYARVYDTGKTFAAVNYRNLKQDAGVWIDIFPLDGVSNDDDERNRDYEDSCCIRDWTIRLRTNIECYRTGKFLERILNAAKIFVKHFTRGSQQSLLMRFDSVCKRHLFGSTTLCANYYCFSAYSKRKIEVLRTEWFKENQLVIFDGTELYITKDFDAVLSSIYGDYMEIPPENQRGGFHTAKFYWKS